MKLDLQKALAAGEFDLHYQPVVNLERHQISGVEALVRWDHPVQGVIGPAAFIPQAEETGLIKALGEWVLTTACAAATEWPESIKVSVNVSPVQFREDGLARTVVAALERSGLRPDRLELEVTEAVALEASETTLATLQELDRLGVHIALDDFGVGYSALGYLLKFPFDKIKIDRSFVKDAADGTGAFHIVRAVAMMANSLGMAVTAEGVETPNQLHTVKAIGCTEGQGFLLGKPLSVWDIGEVLLPRRDRKRYRAAGA